MLHRVSKSLILQVFRCTSTYSLRNTEHRGRIRRPHLDPARWKLESSMLLSRIPDSHKMTRRSSLIVYRASC